MTVTEKNRPYFITSISGNDLSVDLSRSFDLRIILLALIYCTIIQLKQTSTTPYLVRLFPMYSGSQKKKKNDDTFLHHFKGHPRNNKLLIGPDYRDLRQTRTKVHS